MLKNLILLLSLHIFFSQENAFSNQDATPCPILLESIRTLQPQSKSDQTYQHFAESFDEISLRVFDVYKFEDLSSSKTKTKLPLTMIQDAIASYKELSLSTSSLRSLNERQLRDVFKKLSGITRLAIDNFESQNMMAYMRIHKIEYQKIFKEYDPIFAEIFYVNPKILGAEALIQLPAQTRMKLEIKRDIIFTAVKALDFENESNVSKTIKTLKDLEANKIISSDELLTLLTQMATSQGAKFQTIDYQEIMFIIFKLNLFPQSQSLVEALIQTAIKESADDTPITLKDKFKNLVNIHNYLNNMSATDKKMYKKVIQYLNNVLKK